MIATALAVVLLAASPTDALPRPPAGQCVSDPHHFLDAASAAHLERACEQLDRSGDGQLAVAAVSAEDMGDMEKDEFKNELFKKWGIGHKGRDDGLLVVLKPGTVGHRLVAVEVGYGLEGALPDGKVGAMIDQYSTPALKQNRWGDALVPLVDALVAAAHQENAAGNVERRAKAQQQEQGEAATALETGFVLFLLMAGWSISLLVMRVAKKLPGKPITYAGYALLGGGALGALVGGGQFRGQLLVAWAIFAGISAIAYFAVARHRCPKCGGWKNIDSRVLEYPTYWSEGEELVTEKCTHCDYHRTIRKTLPRKTRTVYVGGGGGGGGGGGDDSGFGGFGGGSSGGGGGSREV